MDQCTNQMDRCLDDPIDAHIPKSQILKLSFLHHVAVIAAERGAFAIVFVRAREIVDRAPQQGRHAGQHDAAHVGGGVLFLFLGEIPVQGVPHL